MNENELLIREMGAAGLPCPVVLNRLFSLMGDEKTELFEEIRPAIAGHDVEVTGRTAVLKYGGRQTSYEKVDGKWQLAGFPAVNYTERFLIPEATEKSLKQYLEKGIQTEIEAVKCPTRIFDVAGKKVPCTVTLVGGTEAHALLLLTDSGWWVKELSPPAAKLDQMQSSNRR